MCGAFAFCGSLFLSRGLKLGDPHTPEALKNSGLAFFKNCRWSCCCNGSHFMGHMLSSCEVGETDPLTRGRHCVRTEAHRHHQHLNEKAGVPASCSSLSLPGHRSDSPGGGETMPA